MQHEVIELDLTKDQPEWVQGKVEQLRRIHAGMVEAGHTAIVVTMRGEVRTVAVGGRVTVEVDGEPDVLRGAVEEIELKHVEPIGMLCDDDIITFVEWITVNVCKHLKDGERVMINRLISNWAISVMTADNPQLYVCDVAYVPIWGVKVTEFYAPGGERFLSTQDDE